MVYDKNDAGYLTKLMDLADPRLKGKLTLPQPTDITAGGLLLGLASEMGKDYKDPEQMKEVVDWAVQNLGPNVLKYTTDQADAAAAVRVGRDRRGRLLEQPRPPRVPRRAHGGGAARAADDLPGQRLPVGPEERPAPGARPGLHELAAGQGGPVPQCWPIDHGQWSELSEGFLGPDYVDQVPDWFTADYFTYFPKLDQIQSGFKTIDWEAYNASSKIFLDYYAQQLGQ